MLRTPLFSIFPFSIALLGLPLPSESIPQKQISTKLDSIIVYSPVDPSSGSAPSPLKSKIKGQSRSVYYAAFSPSAITQLIDDKLKPQGGNLIENLKFAPISLAKFDSIVQPILTGDSNSRVIYVPDPSQAKIARSLLIKQGINSSIASKIVDSLPTVFCPKPSFLATPNSGPLKGESFVPCSTDYSSVKALLDRGIATNPSLKAKDYSVLAIPLTQFVQYLAKTTFEPGSDIRLLPNPANIKVLQKLKKN
jgi:hypothetical protein